jgi:hypothetical protein
VAVAVQMLEMATNAVSNSFQNQLNMKLPLLSQLQVMATAMKALFAFARFDL